VIVRNINRNNTIACAGRTFPVAVVYDPPEAAIADNLAASCVSAVEKVLAADMQGDILCFLTGHVS
jgi:HrpA-like RNA helicase